MIRTNIRIGKYSNIFEYPNIRHTLVQMDFEKHRRHETNFFLYITAVRNIIAHIACHWVLYWRCSVRELHITSTGTENGGHLDHILEKLKNGPTCVILLLQRLTDHNLVLFLEYHTWLVAADHFYLILWALDLIHKITCLHQIVFHLLCRDVK